MNAVETIKARARTQDTATLVEAVTAIGPVTSATTIEAKLCRAAMLDVVEERMGEQFVNDLTDAIDG